MEETNKKFKIDKNIETIEMLESTILELIKLNNFNDYIIKREFEDNIREISNKLDLSKLKLEEVESAIDINISNNFQLAFCMFFVLFTKLRRSQSEKIKIVFQKYKESFKEIPLMDFINMLYAHNIDKEQGKLKDNIETTKNLFTNGKFVGHIGVMNLYVEMVCNYYETYLDEKDNTDNKKEIKYAMTIIQKCIDDDENNKKENNNVTKSYEKFILNMGRLYVIQRDYEEGENLIKEAIKKVGFHPEREITIMKYEKFLLNIILIKSEIKLNEVDKTRLESLKQVSIFVAFLAFVLGSIQVFTQVRNPLTLGMLMLGYAGMFLFLLGVVLIGINYLYNERKKKSESYIGGIVLIATGIIMFVIAMIIIFINKNSL